MTTKAYFFLVILFLLSLPMEAIALSNDRDQPIDLEADTADIDDAKGISIYTGNVVLTQGSMQIKAHKLTLYNNKNNELEKAIAEGSSKKLTTFKQRPEGKDNDFFARSEKIIYYLTQSKIHLLKKAYVSQDGDIFRGNKIVYDTKNETIVASSEKNKEGQPVANGERIHITLQPRSNNK